MDKMEAMTVLDYRSGMTGTCARRKRLVGPTDSERMKRLWKSDVFGYCVKSWCLGLVLVFMFSNVANVYGDTGSTTVKVPDGPSNDIVGNDLSDKKLTFNAGNDSCPCGTDISVPCLSQSNVSNSGNCPNGRVIGRKDCSCCYVCAKQLTEQCNNEDELCDSDFGLQCGSDGRCRAKKECSDDTGCFPEEMCIGGACANACTVTPDVCKGSEIKEGVCIVRNHRPICSCRKGQSLSAENECVESPGDTSITCESEGRRVMVGDRVYRNKCKDLCLCGTAGDLKCNAMDTDEPECRYGMMPLSNVADEDLEACMASVNRTLFDGCCVPESCQSQKEVTTVLPSAEEEAIEEATTVQGRSLNLAEVEEASTNVVKNNDINKSNSEITKPDPNLLSEVKVLKKSDKSAVISLPLTDQSAVLSIALVDEKEKGGDKGLNAWKDHIIPPGLSQITLSDLKPSTSYKLKYLKAASKGGEDEDLKEVIKFETDTAETDSKESESSRQASAETTVKSVTETSSEEKTELPIPNNDIDEPKKMVEVPLTLEKEGCLYNGTAYPIGHIVYEGCERRCECVSNGSMPCTERCSIPSFPKGSFAHDKLCFEEPLDDCCVMVACARGGSNTNGKGREFKILPKICESVECGKNAHCFGPPSSLNNGFTQENETLCVCNEGYAGDPYDNDQGCQLSKEADTKEEEASGSRNMVMQTKEIDPTQVVQTIGAVEDPVRCKYNNKTLSIGEEYLDGCSYRCRCEMSGEFLCLPRCSYRKGQQRDIPDGCTPHEDPNDPECCNMLICEGEDGTLARKEPSIPDPPVDGCIYKNKTYERDEVFFDGCSKQCTCYKNGDVTCQPRCPPSVIPMAGEEDCVTLPDPNDSCCMVTLCGTNATDVMKAEDDLKVIKPVMVESSNELEVQGRTMIKKEPSEEAMESVYSTITMINSEVEALEVTVQLSRAAENQPVSIKYSEDMSSWKYFNTTVRNEDLEQKFIVPGLKDGQEYYVRVVTGQSESNVALGTTLKSGPAVHEQRGFTNEETGHQDFEANQLENHANSIEEEENDVKTAGNEETDFLGATCEFKGNTYPFGKTFYDECESLCLCDRGKEVKCVPIQCPFDGMDLVDDECIDWEPDLENFENKPPSCCPDMKCVKHSSCIIEDMKFRNFDEIPQKITGCDKRCYCQFGNITCQRTECPVLEPEPPTDLGCPAHIAKPIPMPHDECCFMWACPPGYTPEEEKDELVSTNVTQNANNDNESKIESNALSPPGDSYPGQLYDQYVPPSTGNAPAIVPLDKVSPEDLENLLHHLTNSGQVQEGVVAPPGSYIHVQTADQAKQLEKEQGAKFVGQAEDGNYILLMPPHQHVGAARPAHQNPAAPAQPLEPNLVLHPVLGHGPPYFPSTGNQQYNPYEHLQVQGVHHLPPLRGPVRTDPNKVTNIRILPTNDTEGTLQIDFTVSPVLVGLKGHVEVLYTKEFSHKRDPSQWERVVFQQAEDIIDNSHLQLFLRSLEPDTEYHLLVRVIVPGPLQPSSQVMIIRTPPPMIPTTTLPPQIEVDPELQLEEAKSNTMKIKWRRFNDFERSLIDGVQIAYKADDEKIYSTTPLIHRFVNEYELTNLKYNKDYEVNILFVPFNASQSTMLKSDSPIFIKTEEKHDLYAFTIKITASKVKDTSVELTVEGIPHPEDKFVNIYQVIYQSEDQKEQKSYFKVPKRETHKKATLTDLTPGTRYSIWLEAFLTNGKKKRSNVIDLLTQPGTNETEVLPENLNEIEESKLGSPARATKQPTIPETTSYYGALVALAIVAALSILGIVILLMILIKKQNEGKAPISDRKSESSYDNPSFKSYDIESNGHANTKPDDP